MVNYSFIIRKAVVEDALAIKEIMQESFKKYMEDTGLTGSMDALEESYEDIVRDFKRLGADICMRSSESTAEFMDMQNATFPQ